MAQLPTLKFALLLIPLNGNILFWWEAGLPRLKLSKRKILGNSVDYRIPRSLPKVIKAMERRLLGESGSQLSWLVLYAGLGFVWCSCLCSWKSPQ